MIDWLSFKIRCYHSSNIIGGQVISLSPNGDIDYMINKRCVVEGSYSSKIMVRSLDYSKEHQSGNLLEISGNPVKFLQGHNIFGTDDVLNLIYHFMIKLTSILGIKPTDIDKRIWRNGEYTISRIDINYMYEMDNLASVNSWIRAAEFKSRTRQGRPTMKGGTLYYGQNSRRWSFKFYAKGEEITVKGRLPDELKTNQNLIDWAQNKLRAELTLRSNELDELELKVAKHWKGKSLIDVHKQYIERIEMTDQVTLPSKEEQALPAKLKGLYHMWKGGVDMKAEFKPRTYYRHRKSLLAYGIDISILQEREPDNVVPLKVLIARPCQQIPDFAKGTDLYFEPKKICK